MERPQLAHGVRKGVKGGINEGERRLVFNGNVTSPQKSIRGQRVESFFFTMKKPEPSEEDEGQMSPEDRESLR